MARTLRGDASARSESCFPEERAKVARSAKFDMRRFAADGRRLTSGCGERGIGICRAAERSFQIAHRIGGADLDESGLAPRGVIASVTIACQAVEW